MRAAVLSAASVLALAVVANAAPFQFLSFEAGGGVAGIDGAGFQTDGANGFFNVAGGTLVGSREFAGGETRAQEYDSYFTIDDFGPSALSTASGGHGTADWYGDYLEPGYNGVDGAVSFSDPNGQSAGGVLAFGITVGTGSNMTSGVAQIGAGISPQPFMSGFAPLTGGGRSTADGVLIARLTINGGASLTGGALFAIKDGGFTFTGNVSLGGGSVVIGGQLYELVAYLVASHVDLVEGGFPVAGDIFATADTYDVWFQVVPTPGTLALLGFGGLAAIRRRRA